MKRVTCAILAMFLFQVSLNSQIGHDTCEDALLVPLDFCDYSAFFTDFSMAQDETSDPNVDPPCSVGPYHDAWFKFSTYGLEFSMNGEAEITLEIITNDLVHMMGVALSDACNGNVLHCDIYETQNFNSLSIPIIEIDTIWVRIWFVNNTFQDIASFCFENLSILSVEDIELKGEIIDDQNQLNWELDSGLDWEQIKLQVYNENKGAFTTIKSFNQNEYSITPNSFSYTDPNPLKSSTYRLLIIDKDETHYFSNTLFIENNDALLEVSLSNPSFDRLHFFANDVGIEDVYQIKVIDANGRQRITSETSTLDGFSLDLSSLMAGIYYVQINREGAKVPQVLKFIKY